MKTALLGFVCGAAVTITLGAILADDQGDVLRATRFELLGPDGQIAAQLAWEEDGPQVILYDAQSRKRVVLGQSPEESGLFLLGDDGHPRLGAALFAHGGAGYALHGPNQEGAAVLYYKDSGSLTFYAPDGKIVERHPAIPPP